MRQVFRCTNSHHIVRKEKGWLNNLKSMILILHTVFYFIKYTKCVLSSIQKYTFIFAL